MTAITYQTNLPENHDFLRNYTCSYTGDICEIFTHVNNLAMHTLKLINNSLPHLSDLEDERKLQTRGIEWFAKPLHW